MHAHVADLASRRAPGARFYWSHVWATAAPVPHPLIRPGLQAVACTPHDAALNTAALASPDCGRAAILRRAPSKKARSAKRRAARAPTRGRLTMWATSSTALRLSPSSCGTRSVRSAGPSPTSTSQPAARRALDNRAPSALEYATSPDEQARRRCAPMTGRWNYD